MRIGTRTSKTRYLLIIFLLVLFVIGAVALVNYRKTIKEFSLNADRYELMVPAELKGRSKATLTDKAQVDHINKTLSGKYREKKQSGVFNRDIEGYICIAVPVYFTDDPKNIDDYAVSPYHEKTKEGDLVYGEGIYIFDEETIGYWKVETDELWIGKKINGKIDTEYMKAATSLTGK